MVLRYWYYVIHSYDRLSDMFYWPAIDLLLFGLTIRYVQQQTGGGFNFMYTVISGVFFWIIVWRAQYEITVNFLEELWNKNLVNLFVAPLNLNEWIVSVFIVGILKMIASLFFIGALSFFLYRTDFLLYGWYLFPFTISLLLTGWVIGLLVTGIIIRFGTKIQTIAWTAAVVISPFSGVYYPTSVLPEWAQYVSKILPPSYIFESTRQFVRTGQVQISDLLISFGLNFFYLFLVIIYMKRSFEVAKKRGLISLF
ncbi:MAG: ABC transporter permease [Patescibacteria group bacterium]